MPSFTRMKRLFLEGLLWLYLLQFGLMVLSLEPGYLDFDNLPETNFTCVGKVIGGYYADLETNCQMFHVCTIGQLDEPMDIRFLCLNGTVFDQETRVCERIDEVDCSKSEQFYSLNLELYGNAGPILEESIDPAQETEPPSLIIKSTTQPSTTTTTSKKPTKFMNTPYFSTRIPSSTPRPTNKPHVISTHHFPVNPDIRFNPEEINISLNPNAPPDIRTKHFLQQSYSDSGKISTGGHDSEVTVKPSGSSSTSPKSVYSVDIGADDDFFQSSNIETTRKPQQQFLIQTNSFRHSQSFPPNEDFSKSQQFQSSTPKFLETPKPPTVHQHHHYTHHSRTDKPPQRVQIPIPLLPTLPPLTFSSPAPFTLQKHIGNKRFTKEHQNPPRIIISASASVSDATGRRLNYSLGTIDAAQILESPPSSYDEYKESDVVLDPFYHDVPKVKQKRRRRSVEDQKVNPFEIIKNEKEAVEVLKFLVTWYQSHQATATMPSVTIPVASDLIHKINTEFAPKHFDGALLSGSSEIISSSTKQPITTESLKADVNKLLTKNSRFSKIGGYKNIGKRLPKNRSRQPLKVVSKKETTTETDKQEDINEKETITFKQISNGNKQPITRIPKESDFNPYDYVDDNYEGSIYKENPNSDKLVKEESDPITDQTITYSMTDKSIIDLHSISQFYKYFDFDRETTTKAEVDQSTTESSSEKMNNGDDANNDEKDEDDNDKNADKHDVDESDKDDVKDDDKNDNKDGNAYDDEDYKKEANRNDDAVDEKDNKYIVKNDKDVENTDDRYHDNNDDDDDADNDNEKEDDIPEKTEPTSTTTVSTTTADRKFARRQGRFKSRYDFNAKENQNKLLRTRSSTESAILNTKLAIRNRGRIGNRFRFPEPASTSSTIPSTTTAHSDFIEANTETTLDATLTTTYQPVKTEITTLPMTSISPFQEINQDEKTETMQTVLEALSTSTESASTDNNMNEFDETYDKSTSFVTSTESFSYVKNPTTTEGRNLVYDLLSYFTEASVPSKSHPTESHFNSYNPTTENEHTYTTDEITQKTTLDDSEVNLSSHVPELPTLRDIYKNPTPEDEFPRHRETSPLLEDDHDAKKINLLQKLHEIEQNLNDDYTTDLSPTDTTATTPYQSYEVPASYGTTEAVATKPTVLEDINISILKSLTESYDTSTDIPTAPTVPHDVKTHKNDDGLPVTSEVSRKSKLDHSLWATTEKTVGDSNPEQFNKDDVTHEYTLTPTETTTESYVEIQKSITLPVSVLGSTFDFAHDINNAQYHQDYPTLPTESTTTVGTTNTFMTTEKLQEFIEVVEITTKSIVAKEDHAKYASTATEAVPTTLSTSEYASVDVEETTANHDDLHEVNHNATEILFVKKTDFGKPRPETTTVLPTTIEIDMPAKVNSSHLLQVMLEGSTPNTQEVSISTTARTPLYSRRTRPSRKKPNNPRSYLGRHRFSTEISTPNPLLHQDQLTPLSKVERTTDAPLHRSATPTRSELKKFSFRTTPLSKKTFNPTKVNKNYVFNCFGKEMNKFYADPRDCRLFHYCTKGYSKNQLLDLKYVCDRKTYFDEDKLICTKSKPERCV
ncbi:uncharacterized protein LOC143199578 [Rhynchophorus ferrugineus]|uniref:uncharacterized protein LOC143199578 n=1 Tax=Rhynchophorus ferrugineus TaxID=354439 RepID=UPI003FCDF35E